MAAPEGYNALGKIGISYKGDYDSNTTYERLDAVEHNGSIWPKGSAVTSEIPRSLLPRQRTARTLIRARA